ncbi:type I-E CRISPR-associated protein Cas7/Cse4/CasC [Inmirania thermothiophila]|uniref:CRISPR-associated Cse4 family protein n=1 Tax=Inmirania thermothiophila TaxID=1750597 RepID=A0A3N1Y2E6_9GAMM|nr:type I-E CRISPR-associated protein Cas7/Cse4/CasC [Inmirania thermothiophila]ROR32701.1 CRISPR-associated Cse4 family protein [Inmirania thermothiophila]
MFLQIHFLTSYHATLLNRDDAGLAKRIPFGGAERLRVSSQCQKRHWREWLMAQTYLPSGLRTREFFGREVKRRLVEGGMDETLAHALILHLAKALLTAAGEKDAVDKKTLAMKQPVLFGRPEADFFVWLIQEAAKQGDEKAASAWFDEQLKAGKKNLKALMNQAGAHNLAAGFEGALFGRFVTSDILTRLDAPVHVAHAFTTHALDTEVDFFTVVDDLNKDEETGAAHAGDMELGAGIFYGYVAVDVPLLVSNLTGADAKDWRKQDHADARNLLEQLIRAIAQVSPGAKRGATAPYAHAEWMLLEVGETQPRSLANAYLQPVKLSERIHPLAQSAEAAAEYLTGMEAMYGKDHTGRWVSSRHPWPRAAEPVLPLPEAVGQALDRIFGAAS